MANWTFVVTEQWGYSKTPYEILCARVGAKFWPLTSRTPRRSELERGDKVILYVGKPEFSFMGTGILGTGLLTVPEPKRHLYAERRFDGSLGVYFSTVSLWITRIGIRELVARLAMFPDKQRWGAYLQGGILPISPADFELITQSVTKDGSNQKSA